MAGKPIDNLSVVVSGDTRPLAQDLKRAAREIDQFAKAADRARATADSVVAARIPRGAVGSAIRTDPFLGMRARMERERAEFLRSAAAYGKPGFARQSLGWLGGHAGTAAGGIGTAASVGFEKVRDVAGAASGSMLGFARSAATVATGVVAAEVGLAGLAGAYNQVRDSIRKAADYERQFVGFEVLLRSADDARAMLADMRRYAAATPFNNREVADAGRQLLAYGFAAEKVMPTIRMLGDVSAAMPDRLPLGDAAYLFGTLRSQGRAYTRDLVQFSNRGISINEELAAVLGKQVHEIQALTEEGRVGFRDVERAFERMTSAGGRFYSMTQRQGQTAAASFEQLGDAVDQLKIGFGTALIEELDLRGASRDLQAFAHRLRDGTSEARPFIRTVGELTRGAVQVGYEFSRAGLAISSIGFESIDAAFPRFRLVREEVAKLVADARDFKLDERQIVRSGFALGGALVESTADATKLVGQYGDGMTRLFGMVVRSAREARDLMKDTAGFLDGMNSAMLPGARFLTRPLAPMIVDLMRQAGDPLRGRGPGDPLNRFAVEPPIVGMSPDRVREEWPGMATAAGQLRQQIERERGEVAAGRLYPVWLRQTEEQLADLRRRQDAYVGGFVGDPAAVRDRLNRGDIPPIRAAGEGGVLSMLERDLQSLRQNVFQPMLQLDVRRFREDWNNQLNGRLAEIDRRQAGEAVAGTRQATFAGAVGPAGMFPPVAPDARVLAASQTRQAAWGAIVGPMAALGAPPRPEPPRPEHVELGQRLRREFDPSVELDAYRRDLDAIRRDQLAGPDTNRIADAAWAGKVRDMAGRFGIETGPARLAAATEVGSVEDARLVNAWRAQAGGAMTTEQLLQQILDVAKLQLNASQGLKDNIQMPAPVKLGP